MKNTDKTQAKQGRGQKKPKVQPREKKQSLEKQQPPAMTMPASEEKFRRLFETAQDGILLLNAETGVINEANPFIEELLGYSRTELIGKKLWEIGPFKDISTSRDAFLELQKKKYIRYEDLPLETKDGRRCNVEFVSNVYRVGSQKVIQCNIRDITQRKQIEAESENRYRELFDNASLGVFQSAVDGRVIAVNPEFARMFGYKSPEEVLALVKNAADIFADPQRRAEIIRLKAENPSLATFENLYRRKDGSTFLGNLTIRQVAGPDGHGLFFEGFIEDITERKRAEERLRQSEAFLDSIVEYSPHAMWISDDKGTLVRLNQACRDLLHIKDEEVIGKYNLFQDDIVEKQGHMPLVRRVFEKGETVKFGLRYDSSQLKQLELEETASVILDVTISPVFDAKGKVTNAIIQHVDVTERRRAEDALRESEERYRSLFELSPDAIAVHRDGKMLFANPAAARLVGAATPDELIGRQLMDFVHPDYRELVIERTRQQVVEGKVVPSVDEIFLRLDGTAIDVGVTAAPFHYQGSLASLVIIHDISERRRAQEALSKSEVELRALFAAMPDVVLVLDKDGRYLKIAPTNPKLLYMPPGELLGKTLADVFPKTEAGVFLERIRAALKKRQTVHMEYSLPIGKQTVWFAASLSPMTEDTVVWVARDITERKQAEEQIRFLSRFPGENPYPVFRIAPDGILLYANKASEPLLAMWHIGVGLSMPDDWLTWIKEVFKSGHNKEVEINCGKRLFSCILTPVVDAGYVNVYGRDITKRKKVEKALVRQTEELRRRNDELARLYRASGSLISGASLNLQELAQTIVEIVQKEFGQANCSLLTVQKDSNELVRLAAAGPYADQVKYQNLALDGPGLVPRAIRTNKVVNAGDVHSDPDYVHGWDAAQSELAIPLKVGSNVIGVIDIQSSEPDAFSPDDERLMAIFVERAALALEHSRLNAQTDSRMQQLIALRTVDMAISGSFDINLTLGVLLDQVTGQLGIHAADILIFNAAAQTFNFSCERGFRTQSLRHTQLKFGAGYAWRLIRERQVINIPDIKKGPDGLQRSPDLSGEQFVAYVGIPLIAKGQIKGVLEIFHREPVKFEPEWYRFLELLAGQAAIAIDNAELFDNLQSSNSELSMAYDSTLEGWASALELRDHETEGHTRRATGLTTRLAQAMGIKENDMVHIYRGALLHDIGKMGVPDSIVLKPGPLTEDEWVTMRKHPQYAYDMLSPISYLRLALDIPYCHHEKWDGTGYPRRLIGAQIPVAARIFAVVDVWDALTSDRPYRKAWTEPQARQYVQEQAGLHFDPEVVKVFLKEVG